MRVQDLDFYALVQGTKQFQIPTFQRSYSWQSKHIERLCEDVTAEANRQQSGISGHFMGSLVLSASEPVNGRLRVSSVIDGQQRLTSLMIALCALRDHIATTDPESARRITGEYLTNSYQHGEGDLRLLPAQIDRADFRACVRGEGMRLSNRNSQVAEAYRAFRHWLRALAVESPDGVSQIELAIRNGLKFVAITADATDNPYRIFETINNTGLPLSQADLIRNYFFMMLQTSPDDVYRNLWLPIRRRVTPQGMGRLIWLDLLLDATEDVDPNDLYRPLVSRFRGSADSEAAVRARLDELGRKSYLLQRIQSPAEEPDAGLREQLERLREWEPRVDFPAWYVPAMFLLQLRERNQATTSDVTAGLRLVESYLVRRLIAEPMAKADAVLRAVPRQLAGTKNVVADLHRMLSTAKLPWPTDAELKEAILYRSFYSQGKAPQRSFVLRRLEEDYKHPERVDWTRPVYTVEHILPQALTPEWAVALQAEATSLSMTTRDLHRMAVHTLGNLTLTGENQRLGNGPWAAKRVILADSALKMNRELAALPAWGYAQINKRAVDVASRAFSIWPGPIDAGQATVIDEWRDLHRALALTPAGVWVGLPQLAQLLGRAPAKVATYLVTETPPNWYRVLGSAGSLLTAGSHAGPTIQRSLLEAEGVRFTDKGLAVAGHKLQHQKLAEQLGVGESRKLVVTKRPPAHLRHKQRKR